MSNIPGASKVYGIAVNDVKNVSTTMCYRYWRTIIATVSGHISNRTSTAEYTVDDAWLFLSNFKDWYDAHPFTNHPDYVMDACWLNCSKVRHYSPDTTAFLPRQLTNFFITPTKGNTHLPIGVNEYASGYQTSISIKNAPDLAPIAHKVFSNTFDAHMNYLYVKKEMLIRVRESYEIDERVHVIIDLVLDRLQYHIDNRIELTSLYDLFN